MYISALVLLKPKLVLIFGVQMLCVGAALNIYVYFWKFDYLLDESVGVKIFTWHKSVGVCTKYTCMNLHAFHVWIVYAVY